MAVVDGWNDQVEAGTTVEGASTDRTNEERMTAVAQHVHDNTAKVGNRAQNPVQQQIVCHFSCQNILLV